MPLVVNHYVIFRLLDISAKICDDSFIGCEYIGLRENALNWLMLEVLPKSGFGGINRGG